MDPRLRAAAALLLLALPALAGCAAPEPPLRARPGDFAVVDLVAHDAAGKEVLNLTGAHAVLAAQVPPRLPAGWDPNATVALPPGVRAALAGARPGATLETGLLAPEDGFGPWDPARTIAAPLRERLPRERELPAGTPILGPAGAECDSPCQGDAPTVRWANHTWQVEPLGEANGTVRVRLLSTPEPGARLELPDYWNERYRLWRSEVVGADDEAIEVRHLPEPGRSVLVGGQAYRVVADPERAVADGNHPLARERLAFRATLHRLAFAGSGDFPVAPDVMLVAENGTRINLSDLRGRAVLLDFFATWCITCKQQAPILARAEEAFGDRLAIVSVTIDPTDTPDRMAAFRAEARRASEAAWGRPLPANWTYAFDPTGEGARAFSVAGIPREVLLDAEGRIRSTSVGLHPWPALRDEVRAVLDAA